MDLLGDEEVADRISRARLALSTGEYTCTNNRMACVELIEFVPVYKRRNKLSSTSRVPSVAKIVAEFGQDEVAFNRRTYASLLLILNSDPNTEVHFGFSIEQMLRLAWTGKQDRLWRRFRAMCPQHSDEVDGDDVFNGDFGDEETCDIDLQTAIDELD